MKTFWSKIIANPNLNLSRRFPLDTDCNTQTKKILLEESESCACASLGTRSATPSKLLESTYNHNPQNPTERYRPLDSLYPSLPFFLSRPFSL